MFELLKSRNAALVQSESDEQVSSRCRGPPIGRICGCGGSTYTSGDLERWLARIAAAGVAEAQVFFKHEDGATGPKLAAELLASGQQ